MKNLLILVVIFIIILISLSGVYFFIKLLGSLTHILGCIIFITFTGFIIGFFINEIPSYSFGIGGFFIGMIFGSILYLKIFKNDIFYNIKKHLNFIISTQLLFIFLINLLLILPFGTNFKSQKHEMILEECFEKVCYNVYYMKDGFFFGDDYIQVYQYYNNAPFIIFKKNILNKNIEKIKINKEKKDYIMEYILNFNKYSIKL